MKNKNSRLMPIWALILVDALFLAAFLSFFCYFHHVRAIWGVGIEEDVTQAPVMVVPKPTRPEGTMPSASPTESGPVQTVGSVPAPSSERTPVTEGSPPVTGSMPPITESSLPVTTAPLDRSGDFGEAFPEVFAKGEQEVNRGKDYYQSHDLSIKVTEMDADIYQLQKKGASKAEKSHVRYFLADIYVRNIENLFTSYSVGGNKPFQTLLSGTGACFALSGDVFNSGQESKEIIIRNGNVIRCQDYISSDICVLFWDGTMETYTPKTFDWNKIVAKAPYQAWSFGPSLLNEDGSPKAVIDSAVWRPNPRAAIGYVEPGHYVMLGVHGDRGDDTVGNGGGLNLAEVAKILSEAGCKQGYNLDGGASVYCYFNGDLLISFSSKRSISDIICIGEVQP